MKLLTHTILVLICLVNISVFAQADQNSSNASKKEALEQARLNSDDVRKNSIRHRQQLKSMNREQIQDQIKKLVQQWNIDPESYAAYAGMSSDEIAAIANPQEKEKALRVYQLTHLESIQQEMGEHKSQILALEAERDQLDPNTKEGKLRWRDIQEELDSKRQDYNQFLLLKNSIEELNNK